MEIRCAGKATLDEAAQRCSEMATAVLSALQDDPSLNGLNQVLQAVVSEARGPWPIRTPDGCLAFAQLVVTVEARIE